MRGIAWSVITASKLAPGRDSSSSAAWPCGTNIACKPQVSSSSRMNSPTATLVVDDQH